MSVTKGALQIHDVDGLEATLEITMTIAEWRVIAAELEPSRLKAPVYDYLQVIRNLVKEVEIVYFTSKVDDGESVEK